VRALRERAHTAAAPQPVREAGEAVTWPLLTQAEYKSLKRKLAIAENRLKRATGYPGAPNYLLAIQNEDDPRIPLYKAILVETKRAWAIFEAKGYPDSWASWRLAGNDAAWQLGRFYDADEYESITCDW